MNQEKDPKKTSSNDFHFQKKVWTATAIISFTLILLSLVKSTFNVLLLVLAGSLIAIFFRALIAKLQRRTKWKEGICVALSIISTLMVLIAIFWLIGAKVQEQMVELAETLPKTIEIAKIA